MSRPLAFLLAVALTALPVPLAAQQAAPDSEYPGLETGKMWTFDAPPLDYWARRYDFRPTPAWLDHVRLAAARLPGCSASFVSPDGLVMTNHHCTRQCIESSTKPGEDLLENGFYAATRAEERPCQGFFLDELLAISDVTDSVNAAMPTAATAQQAAQARTAAIRGIEQRCGQTSSDAFCQVVPMYRGGQYKLYRFRRFTDVRLVFAVESQTAFFGGDPDNFTFPRHDLDVSFARAYVNGQPAHPEYLKWSQAGAVEGDLVFVVGNPGSTGRLNTAAQLEFLRDVQYPAQLAALRRQIGVYHDLSARSDEQARRWRNTLFGLENTQKAITGYQSGLLDPSLMARKRAWERGFRARVDADPGLKARYGEAWTRIAAIRRRLAQLDARRRFYAFGAYGSRLLGLAGLVVRSPVEAAKPDTGRLAAFRDANRANLERVLYGATPVDTALERRLLAAYLTAMAADLPATDPVRRAALGGRTPEQAAAQLVANSQILTADARRALVQGGAAAAAASSDPFIALARVIDPLERQMTKEITQLTDEEDQLNQRIAQALLAVFGNTVSPDATFSLRIGDGEVRRYPANGTYAQPFTTLFGLYDRSAGFGGKEPWNLAPRWAARRDSLNLATPLNGVATADIIGGNSGSPIVNRDGEVVGLIFDENIEALPHRFLYTELQGRSVWVDVRGILEALRRVYDAKPLADEIAGGS